jgi:hypothetical protein
MSTHDTHKQTFRVLVIDELAASLANGETRHYESPPQTEQQALALVRILIGGAGERPGPWRQAIAGGRRTIELRPEP